MSTHNICFCGKLRKNINTFWLKKKCLIQSYAKLSAVCDVFNAYLGSEAQVSLCRCLS